MPELWNPNSEAQFFRICWKNLRNFHKKILHLYFSKITLNMQISSKMCYNLCHVILCLKISKFE
jgi:hypothetical protein